MNKIEEILKSWSIAIHPNKMEAKLASERIQICHGCEFKKTNPAFGVHYCGVCGCALKAKIFSPKTDACPKGKWDNVNIEEEPPKKVKQLRFLSAQPANIYYSWQVEVMLNNFLSLGMNLNYVDIVCSIENDIIPEKWIKLAEKYAARFFFYNDTRSNKRYVSSVRPHILKQHFKKHPYLKDDAIFYHDSDILFTKNPNEWITREMIQDDIWYGSDTRWYISHSYIKSKGNDILEKMCDIVNIDEKLIKLNENNTIGAQYLMKGINHYYWDKVQTDCENLFNDITEYNQLKKKQNADYHEIQIWCADMWAVLWNSWKMGKETKCSPNMLFSWGTSTEEEYFKHNIFHNAGVLNTNDELFYKGHYTNKLPYNDAKEPKEKTSSWHYWNWIQKTSENSCLI